MRALVPALVRALVLALLLLVVPLAPGASAADVAPAPSHEAVWPLQPRPPVAEGFDPPQTRWGRGHRGVDLLGRPGQTVHAALSGRITFAAVLAGRGVVVVDHGSFRTTYEPVDALVEVGQVVGRGEAVGVLRRSGSHCAPQTCLHWGMRRGDDYLDPLVLVGAEPVRLLPLDGVAAPRAAALPVAPLVVVPAARVPAASGVRAV